MEEEEQEEEDCCKWYEVEDVVLTAVSSIQYIWAARAAAAEVATRRPHGELYGWVSAVQEVVAFVSHDVQECLQAEVVEVVRSWQVVVDQAAVAVVVAAAAVGAEAVLNSNAWPCDA